MKCASVSVFFVVELFGLVQCARILGVWTLGGQSHYILGNTLMKGLADAGHDVTLLSPFEDKVPPKRGSYRNIVLTGVKEKYQDQLNSSVFFRLPIMNSPISPVIMQKWMGLHIEDALSHPNVQTLLKSGEKFDVVIIEQFSNDVMKSLAHHFDAHLIIFSSIFASSWVNGMVGNPMPLSYIPELSTSFRPKMTFFERTLNTIIYTTRQILVWSYVLPAQEAIRNTYFPEAPTVYDSYRNASLILLNGHESLNQPVPLVPNMIPIGGYHIQPPKKLSEDLQKILDEAKDGVVYVSMGSNLKSKDMPNDKKDIIMKSLGKLKEKVLWKWEDSSLSGKPKNVEIRNWFPQSDILGHPNVKLFVTHGGLLSTTETIYHGKPILTIPVFGDQLMNAHLAEQNGYARKIAFHDTDWSEERFYALLRELLDNSKYRENAQKRSKIFHDRPIKPMDAAVYWIEYVIRNNGASHLRVLGADLPWYKYFLFDVIFVMLSSIFLVIFVLTKLIKLTGNHVTKKNPIKVKKS